MLTQGEGGEKCFFISGRKQEKTGRRQLINQVMINFLLLLFTAFSLLLPLSVLEQKCNNDKMKERLHSMS